MATASRMSARIQERVAIEVGAVDQVSRPPQLAVMAIASRRSIAAAVDLPVDHAVDPDTAWLPPRPVDVA